MRNLQQTIISQYANSPIICGMIERFNRCIDPRADAMEFYRDVWDSKRQRVTAWIFGGG